jgi:CHAD domain-containing protein
MPYRLDLDVEPAVTARNVLADRLERAVARLDANEADAELVHEVRKELKRSRSLLRLMRPALPDRLYEREMARLRHSARALSAARDAEALPAALEKLADTCAGQVPESTFDALAQALAERTRDTGLRAAVTGEREALQAVRDGIDEWPLRAVRWGDLLDRLEATYRRGRKAFARARREPSTEKLHEWRKRDKDLLYQWSLMEDAWPTVIEAYVKQAHDLADLLGDDHDLAVLVSAVEGERGLGRAVPATTEELLDLARRRRLQLQAGAWALGERLYAETPKDMLRRMKRLVRTARAQSRSAPLERAA